MKECELIKGGHTFRLLAVILIQALPIFLLFLIMKDFCDGGTLHEKIVSAREVSKLYTF